jgi:hypothetical protein
MQTDSPNIPQMASKDERTRRKQFWKRAFIIYALVEIFIILVQYFTTRSKCVFCVLPPVFYVVNWLQQLLFTGALWYFLNRVYFWRLWKAVTVNFLLFTAHFFLWITVLYFIFLSGIDWLVWENIPYQSFRYFIYGSWQDIGKYVLKFSAFYVLKFYYEFRRAEQQRIQLAVINKDMQVNLLKQQLSPHFYFNTLNNLYGLARGNSFKLEGALTQLSNIMKYVLVECNQPKVLLRDEITFLQSYIALEKLRYESNTVIEMNVNGNAGSCTILPLLLVQFVENAFKHGMKEKSDENWMKVNMNIHNETLVFQVENSNYETTPSNGIGINSVKRILGLQYEGKHQLEMMREHNRFYVTLKLNIA